MVFRLAYRRRAFQAGAILVFVLTGCNDGRKPVYPVQGQVLDAEGKPAAGAKVIFHPTEDRDPNAPRPIGVVEADGAFSLTTYYNGDGAPPGAYAVTVEWRPAKTSPFSPTPEDQLKGRFANPGKTPFKATVEKQANTLEPIRLN